MALCGTVPQGVDAGFYADIARRARGHVLVVDACRDIGPTLETGLVDVLKINRDEILELTGEGRVAAAAARLRRAYGIASVAVTAGGGAAEFHGTDGAWTCRLPPPPAPVVNPLGAGDTATGVMVSKLAAGAAHLEAFRWGLAAATASCLHLGGACFDIDQARALYAGIELTR